MAQCKQSTLKRWMQVTLYGANKLYLGTYAYRNTYACNNSENEATNLREKGMSILEVLKR